MTTSDWVARVAAAYRAGRRLALLFDFDGTLAPIVPQPSRAALPDAARDALATLAGRPGVRVGVLSGRPLTQIQHLVGLPNVWYAGSGGMHLDMDGAGVMDEAVAGFEAIAEHLCVALFEVLRGHAGVWVERKPGCLTAHYRALTPARAETFVAEAREALAALDPDCPPLRVVEVDRGLEVALAGSWTKGEAVDRMLRAVGGELLAVYAGNAANDEPAMARVEAWGGVTIRVGAEPPMAQEAVASPHELSAMLLRLAAGLTATGATA